MGQNMGQKCGLKNGSAKQAAFTAKFGLTTHSRPLWIHFSDGYAARVFKRFFIPCFHPPIPEAFLTLPVISRPSSNMGQKHGSGGFPLPRQKPTPIPRCRDCTKAFRNCKSFLPKRNCRRMVSTDTTRRQLTIRSNQISGNLTLLTNQFATNAVRASAVSLDFSSPAVCAISAAIASLSIFSLSSRKACLKSKLWNTSSHVKA